METNLAILLLFIVLVTGILYFTVIEPFIQNYKRMKHDEKRIRKNYLIKSGSTNRYFPPKWNKFIWGDSFNYYLKSFDAGKNWYAVDVNKLGQEVVILGNVNDVYPGLTKHLLDMDKLPQHLSKNHTINFKDNDYIDLLTDAGFTVSQTK